MSFEVRWDLQVANHRMQVWVATVPEVNAGMGYVSGWKDAWDWGRWERSTGQTVGVRMGSCRTLEEAKRLAEARLLGPALEQVAGEAARALNAGLRFWVCADCGLHVYDDDKCPRCGP